MTVPGLRFRRSLLPLLVLAFLLMWAAAAGAQTTGGLTGRVADSSGGGLPGVTVEARSPDLQGIRVAATDVGGGYRLTLLPPGSYEVRFSLSGFGDETVRDVIVRLGRDTALDASLAPSPVIEEITVMGELPVVDTTSTTLGTNLDAMAIESLPSGRNYSSIVQVAPGTSSDANPENKGQSTITVYGSSGAENAFYIDGVNTTGVEYGFQGKELNYEFIREIDVKTGGYEAEYGRSTGGIVNVITKSGGNEFHGDVFGYFDDDGFQANSKRVVSTGGTVEGFTKEDYGADVGGFILKDSLWFFAAYDRVSHEIVSSLPDGPRAGETVTSESSRDLGSAKLTWRLSDSHTVVGSFLQDPRTDTGAINDNNHSLNGETLTYAGRQDFGGRDAALRYDGFFAGGFILSGQVAQHKERNSVGPAGGAGDVIQYRFVDDNGFQRGGFGLIQKKNFERMFYGAAISKLWSAHEVKLGIEYEEQEADVTKRMSGGQLVEVYDNPVDPSRPIYRHFYWTTPDATVNNAPISALSATPRHENTTIYLQDRWRALENLTINAGVRWDRQLIIDASGTEQIDLDKDYAPRLGFVWDPTRDRRSKVFGSFGRFYEQIPMDLVIRSFSFERQPRIFNYDPTSNRPDAQAEADLGTESAILGGFTEPSDPNIRNQYLEEIVIGGEREVMPHVAVGAKIIFREYGEVVEDFLCADDGTYCIGNPGTGIMNEIFTLDYSRTIEAPDPKREYKGIQLDVTKRFSDGWQGLASYLWSELEGNFDGGYAPFTNIGADPNISAAYDYYDFFTNGSDLTRITNTGPLSNDRRHQFKVSGVYMTPFKLSVGVTAYWRSGTPVTRYGYSDAYGRYEFFLTKRGAEGRTPDTYETDVHLGYPISAGPVTINVLLDVFNLLDAQRPILLDQRWGFQEADNASATPVNPGYKQAVLRTPPTSVRLGLRVSF